MKKLIQIIIVTTFLTSCGNDEITPLEQDIVGIWNWAESTGGIGGILITPSSEGYQRSIEYKADGTYQRYRNGVLESEGEYRITKGESKILHKEVLMVQYANHYQILSFNDDYTSIYLSHDFVDGFNEKYVKITINNN